VHILVFSRHLCGKFLTYVMRSTFSDFKELKIQKFLYSLRKRLYYFVNGSTTILVGKGLNHHERIELHS